MVSLAEDKAPEPDDFPLFVRWYLFIIQFKVMVAVQDFFTYGQILDSWKRTSLC